MSLICFLLGFTFATMFHKKHFIQQEDNSSKEGIKFTKTFEKEYLISREGPDPIKNEDITIDFSIDESED